MRYLLFYWAILLGICHDSWGQVVRPQGGESGYQLSVTGKNGGRTLITDNQSRITDTRQCLVKTALSQTHVRERTGRNDGAEIRKYLKTLNLPEGTPYCGAFVEWVYRQCGVVSNVQAPAVAYSWAKYPNRIVWNKSAVLGKKVPQQGDVAVFAWRQRRGGVRYHSEMVIEWQDEEDIEDFVTVGGNTSSPTNKKIEGVFRKLRNKDIAIVSNHLSAGLAAKPRPLF
jgi:CHAP domain